MRLIHVHGSWKPVMNPLYAQNAAKRPVNFTLNSDLVRLGKELGINLSGVGEPGRDRSLQPADRGGGCVQRWVEILLMGAFAVHRNLDARTQGDLPFLLDVQSEVLAILGTRVVVWALDLVFMLAWW